MTRTFTVLGGGSAYTPGLLQALLHHSADMDIATVRLFDLDEDRAALVARLGTGLARTARIPLRVVAVSTLEAALKDTDVVLNSTRPGGLECRRIDETLPLDFGIPGQETVGPGGFFYALRSIPEALRVADLLTRVAPRAMLLNYTNPSNIVTQALLDHGAAQVIGLCDQSAEDLHVLAQASGKPEGSWSFGCQGLNHATWYRDLALDGQPWRPSLPLDAPAGLDAEHRLRFDLSKAMAADTPGYWPNSYLPYYLFPERFVDLARQSQPRSEIILKKLPDYYAHFREEAAKDHPVLRLHRGSEGFGDLAVTTIRALGSQTPLRLVLNVPNEEAIPRLSKDTVVEVPALLGAEGVTRDLSGGLPDSAWGLLKPLEDYQRLTAEAATSGSGALMEKALAANPLVKDPSMARALLAEARARYAGQVEAFA